MNTLTGDTVSFTARDINKLILVGSIRYYIDHIQGATTITLRGYKYRWIARAVLAFKEWYSRTDYIDPKWHERTT